jgi:predicted acylesterase/phospholipase RssA
VRNRPSTAGSVARRDAVAVRVGNLAVPSDSAIIFLRNGNQAMSDLPFVIVHQAIPRQDGLWDWEIGIVGPNADVEWVMYGLHACFLRPNRIVTERDAALLLPGADAAARFALHVDSDLREDATWGTFDVRVTIALRNGERVRRVVPLTKIAASALLPVAADASYDACKRIYGYLKYKSAFGYALQVLERAAALPGATAPGEWEWREQQRALCTYKDAALQDDARLLQALEILRRIGLDDPACKDPETLGLGGAVYKRLSQITHALRDLQRALHFYRKAYDCMRAQPQRPDYDAGAFSAVNAALVLDLLALQDDASDAQRADLRRQARELRVELAQAMSDFAATKKQQGQDIDWWLAASRLETHFALATDDPIQEQKVADQAAFAATLHPSPWQRQSTAVQLLRLAGLHKRLTGKSAEIDARLQRVLSTAFGEQIHPAAMALDGKFGLALSGGGFRASLFHIGVLARLAELDLLRHVEVLSCVSGGSIVGAHYYLLLRELLQRKHDSDITRDDYIAIVDTLLQQSLDGIQRNIRMRVGASWTANLRMIQHPDTYSRTERLGDLYERLLYQQVPNVAHPFAPPAQAHTAQRRELWLNECFITPFLGAGKWDDGFSPKSDNWRRAAKVPVLVLNATSLNTGRNWQFTASSMGESASYGTNADSTERLEPVYYSQAPERWSCFRLGHAVAASSCVPGLFTPIALPALYDDRTVRLVDGGVHDNQGSRALLDNDCDQVVISDASGQMSAEANPAHAEIGVVLRMNSVLQARIRVAQHQELQVRQRIGLLRRFDYLHLRKEVESRGVPALPGMPPAPPSDATTTYDVNRDVQRALSTLRTDLDSFTDREALSLMYSGYMMAQKYVVAAAPPPAAPPRWRFFAVRDACNGTHTGACRTLLRDLDVGRQIAFKVWSLVPALRVAKWLLGAAAAAAVLYCAVVIVRRDPPLTTTLDWSALLRYALWMLVPIALAAALPKAKRLIQGSAQALHIRSLVTKIAFGVAMSILGWLLCRVHVVVFDRLFLRHGKVP